MLPKFSRSARSFSHSLRSLAVLIYANTRSPFSGPNCSPAKLGIAQGVLVILNCTFYSARPEFIEGFERSNGSTGSPRAELIFPDVQDLMHALEESAPTHALPEINWMFN